MSGPRFLIRWMIPLLALGLVGCEQDMSDLERYVAEVKQRPGGRIEPLPQAEPYENYVYGVSNERSPFVPDVPTGQRGGSEGESGSGISPDFDRNREFLEEFPLDSLDMVGTVVTSQDEIYGLVRTPEGDVYRIQVGNYMGQNHGRITDINEQEISLIEIVPDGLGGWMERDASVEVGG